MGNIDESTAAGRLRRARRASAGDITQDGLDKRLGLNRGRTFSYKSGKANPPDAYLKAVAPLLGTTFEYLRYGEAPVVDKPLAPVSFDRLPIKVVAAVPCGSWEDPSDTEDLIEIEAKFYGAKRFASRIVGDSCWPVLQPGDLSIWQREPSAPVGTIVLARDANNAATVKRLAYKDGRFVLESINPRYPNAEAETWSVVGFLVGIVRMDGTTEISFYNSGGIRP